MQTSHLQHVHDGAEPLSPLLSQQLPPSHLPPAILPLAQFILHTEGRICLKQ